MATHQSFDVVNLITIGKHIHMQVSKHKPKNIIKTLRQDVWQFDVANFEHKHIHTQRST